MGLLGSNYDAPGGNLRLLWDRSHITDEEQAQIARVTVANLHAAATHQTWLPDTQLA